MAGYIDLCYLACIGSESRNRFFACACGFSFLLDPPSLHQDAWAIRGYTKKTAIYSLRLKINAILGPSTQTNATCKITKIFFVFCEEWMRC